jgi:4-alpha-glucanotransferase
MRSRDRKFSLPPRIQRQPYEAMTPNVYLCLVLHNHQPIGNFDGVFEQAYQDSYLPFLDVFEPFERLAISLHTSGPLMMWLAERHPEYLDRVRLLVDAGRIEIVGGPQYEPIMTMLPRRDRIGQITAYTQWLERNLGANVSGMWTPERVWESSLTSDIAEAGIAYTVLDDFHFRAAGLTDEQLTGYYITEDDGRLLRIFPGSEKLRYTIPFAPVHETIDYCRQIAYAHPGAVLTFGDDGEKFGTWPDTKVHVYDRGWLRSFLTALTEQSQWLHTVTLADAIRNTAPVGKVYLPDCSYREMTEWSLPTSQQSLYEDATHAMDHDERWPQLKTFVRGGFWRNFKMKYAEANEMYARMMDVSQRLQTAEAEGADSCDLAIARDHLYRGQCNCPYWHGAFGGIYLPHLRNAVFHHLIQADNILERLAEQSAESRGATSGAAIASVGDFDFDGMQEVRLSNQLLCAWVSPGRGGRMYELDVRAIGHNLLATMQRRPEAYHRKVLAGPSAAGSDVASIHDRVVFKQAGLDQRLGYDRFARKSMMDHFFDHDVTLDAITTGRANERGDFVEMPFDAKLRRGGDRVQLQMRRDGNAWGHAITITKAITMVGGSSEMIITYLLENLPQDRSLHFGIEMNFAGLPSGADDRYFSDRRGNRLGQLGHSLDLHHCDGIALSDQWLGIDVELELDRSSSLWATPVETVSQSEGGFELVHQSVCVIPHWIIEPTESRSWAVRMNLRTRCREQADIEVDERRVVQVIEG